MSGAMEDEGGRGRGIREDGERAIKGRREREKVCGIPKPLEQLLRDGQ